MNELQFETSPYLLQHAQNPVHWKAWNEKSLQEAKVRNKLLLVSIGYSACHWCHVMEHETFENDSAAVIMNEFFVNIKVDREERPDIDAIYMKAVQLMTGRGGWPLNVICLPDGRPVWGGTYFRKNDWINTLEQLQELYLTQPEKMIEYAEKLHDGIESLGLDSTETTEIDFSMLDFFLEKWSKSFDWEFGGYQRAPKFMMPTNYQFLLQFGHLTKNEKLLEYVHLTLTKMAYGGIFDVVDGGFSRYSVDTKWHVPHFEKMAYDNGQLLSLYANAYKLSKNELYKEIIEKTISFIEKEWLTDENAFFSALDADSLTDENHLEEGAFYVWTKNELQTILKDDFELFASVFSINDFGFWEKEHYVLIQRESLHTIAIQFQISEEELNVKKRIWEKLLYTEREKRKKPRLDDKIITSWNAMILKGLVESYKALQHQHFLDLALKNAHFIVSKLWDENGNLWHTYKNKKTSINGFLDDYAFVIDAFIALYEITLDEKWLKHCKNLTDYCLDYFYDEQKGLFRFTSNLDNALISNHYEIEDNVIPSSNSQMSANLFKLGIYFENGHYESISKKMVSQIIPSIDYPSAFSNWLIAALHFSTYQKELGICGPKVFEYLDKINQSYFPSLLLAGSEKKSDLTFLKNRFKEGETLFYVCQNRMCLAPKNNFNEMYKDLID